ncbi:hypothetical protein KAJ41_01335 [Candidatus Parcubacteria bacterium]|nr:hypothetical protein [Candidatus Parcubacteria bacterium]
MKKILFLALTGLILISSLFNTNNKVLAQENNSEKIRIIYFYADDCVKCQKIKPFIGEIKEKYSDKIDFLEHDVKGEEQCRQLFYNFVEKYNVPDNKAGTPLIFVGNEYLSGPNDITDKLEDKINQNMNTNEKLLFDCHEFLDAWPNVNRIDFLGGGGDDVCSIEGELCSVEITSNKRKQISLTLIAATAAIDSINPCAIAVLIFLITALISLKTSRRRMLKIGMIYIAAVFATYYLAGLGLMRIITRFDIATQIGIFAGIVVLLAGFLEIKEGLYPNGKQLLVIPKKTKPIFVKFLKKGTIPSVVIAGVLVSAFELPCTGQVYLAILSMLSQESMQAQGYLYLFVYNIIFVLPLIFILFIAAWGFDIEKMEHMRQRTRMIVKTLMGLIMILLGLFLLYQEQILGILGK